MIEIKVVSVVGHTDLFGGDGVIIADAVASQLSESQKDVGIDFSGVTAASPSAASRFFFRLSANRPTSDLKRVVIFNASPWVRDTFESVAPDNQLAGR